MILLESKKKVKLQLELQRYEEEFLEIKEQLELDTASHLKLLNQDIQLNWTLKEKIEQIKENIVQEDNKE